MFFVRLSVGIWVQAIIQIGWVGLNNLLFVKTNEDKRFVDIFVFFTRICGVGGQKIYLSVLETMETKRQEN